MGKRAGEGGFTVAELLTVMAIVAVLVAMAIPIFSSNAEKAEDAVCSANRGTAQRKIAAELITGRKLTTAEKNGIAHTAMLGLGATDAGDGRYAGLCPGDGVHTVTITEQHYAIIYCSEHGGAQWKTGQAYEVGDLMESNGYIFYCLRAHTTGTTSRTRDPSLRSNKSTWEVIGYTGERKDYSSTVRYAVGLEVVYKGKTYVRTGFNLVGGQVPYENRSSDYWTLVSSA